MWESILKILAQALAIFSAQQSKSVDKSEILESASPDSLEELADSWVSKEVWKNLSQAQREKIKYIRRKKREAKKRNKLNRFLNRLKKRNKE